MLDCWHNASRMASKSSTSNDEDDDDYGAYFIPWLDLIFGVDNTSTDLLLSNEELLTERLISFLFPDQLLTLVQDI
jgi:hypothetical protein